MLGRRKKQIDLDVLIIDNMSGQAKSLQSVLENGGLKVTSLVLSVPIETRRGRQIPQDEIDKVVSFIKKHHPGIVLVDVCLDERLFDTAKERTATWTGPALMSEIRKRLPEQKMASYTAYAQYVGEVDQDIEDQRKRYGVSETPHWNVGVITAEAIRVELPIEQHAS